MLPTKLLVLFSAYVIAVSGQGISYYGTSNVRNQSRPPPHPLSLQPTSYESQPDNAPRPVYVPPPPVAPAPEMTANPVPVYAVSPNQYQPSPAPLQTASQPAPLSAQPNLWSSGVYSRPTQPLGPSRPLPPLPPPTPTTIAYSSPEPEPEIMITEGPSLSSNNWHPQPISSEPLQPPPITPIRDKVLIEENQSGEALTPTTTTPSPEIVVIVEPEKAPEPTPIETVNPPSQYQEAPPGNNPITRQHIIPGSYGALRPPGSNNSPMPQSIPVSPGSNYIRTTLRPPPIFPPLNPAPRNPEVVQPPTYPIYPSPSGEPKIPTLPPLKPISTISFVPVRPSEEEPLYESTSTIPEPSSSIIPSFDTVASSESDSGNPVEVPEPSPAPLPPPEEPIVPLIEPPAPSPVPVDTSEKPMVPPIELPALSPEPSYPPPEPKIPPVLPTPEPPLPSTQPPVIIPGPVYHPQPIEPIQPPPPRPEPLYPLQQPIIPPIERPAPTPIPLYPTPEPPLTSTQPPVIIPGPVYHPQPIEPIQPPPPRPEPLYPPQQPIIPPIERPAPTQIPLYPTPEPPAPSTQPPARKPAPNYPPGPITPEPIPTLKPAPLYPPTEPIVPPVQPPNPQPLYPPTNPTNRPPAFVPRPLESKLIIGFTCSRGNGYYAVAEQCDSYVECQANQAWQIYCHDGLHFNPNAAYPDYPCAYPSEVKCAASTVKQVAQPTSECPRQYGFFPSSDGDCSKYVNCQEGKATLMNCPFGLVFNDALSSCDWPENVPQCDINAFKDFICPAPPVDSEGKTSDIIYKYKYGSHCKMYLACQRGHPRLLRCDSGLSFDEKSQACIDSDLVPECSMRT